MKHIGETIHLSVSTARDMAYLFLGKVIGEGMSRTVYAHPFDATLVIKVESTTNYFQNVMEWNMWESVQYTKYAKWFAPCVAISSCGLILIQKRAEAIPLSQYPKRVPTFFSDIKPDNFGVIGKQFVCFDYGTAPSVLIGRTLSDKTKVVKWDK